MDDWKIVLLVAVVYTLGFVVGRRTKRDRTRAIIEALEGGGWMYAYDIGKAAGLSPGSTYPELVLLERTFVVETRWEDPYDPAAWPRPRREYRLRQA